MKKITVLGALALAMGVMAVAVLMFAPSFGGTTPALAHKVEICHWDTGFTKSNPGSASFREPSWVVISVNHNAQDSHVGVHTAPDGTTDALMPAAPCL